MTVQTNTNSIAYVGNGSTVHFDYDFLILDDDHLKVYFGDAIQTSGYVVSGVGSQTGGTVAFAVAPSNGTNITLTRDVPFTQLTDYQPYDAFPAETHERALDLLTMMAQQLKDSSDRSMQYPVGGNKWDAKGNEIINAAEGGSDNSAANVGQVKDLIAHLAGPDSAAQLRSELLSNVGSSLVGTAVYADINTYDGEAARLVVSGGAVIGDGGDGVFLLDPMDTTSPAVTGMVLIDALNRRWKRDYKGYVLAKWFLIKGDKITDDTVKFIEASAYCKANKKQLRIDNMKIVLRTLSASINLDDWGIVGNGVPSTLPVLHLDYLNGTDQADSVWLQEADFIGSAIYCPANLPAFTGKSLHINGVLLVGDYNKPNNDAFRQTAPTSYPGWSRAFEGSSCTIHYFGGYGVYLLGGLEVCSPKDIKIAFTKQNNLRVDGLNATINCPIEYLYFDESNYFMYSKVNNVLLNGMRKDVEFAPKLLLNGPGQFDVVKHFNPSFSLASIGEALAAVSVVAAPAGTYGGLAHSGSYGLIFSGYAEACQNLLTVSNGFLNDVVFKDTVMYVVDPAWPKAQLITYNTISEIRTNGNKLPDGKFYYWLDTSTRNSLVAIEIGEEALAAAVNVGGAIDPNKKIIANFSGPWLQLGNGLGGDARIDLDNFFQPTTPVNTSAKPITLLVTTNSGSAGATDSGAYFVIAMKLASGNWRGIVMTSGVTNGFASPPVVAADGQLSMNLAAGYYASVTRVDGLALS